MKSTSAFRLAHLAPLLFALAACGGGNDDTDPAPSPAPAPAPAPAPSPSPTPAPSPSPAPAPAPVPSGTGDASDCVSVADETTTGSAFVLLHQISGSVSGQQRMEGQVTGRAAFGGATSAIERKTTFSLQTQPPSDKPQFDTWQYYEWDGLTRRNLGVKSSMAVEGISVSTTLTHQPAKPDARFTLKPGQTVQVSGITNTVTVSMPGLPEQVSHPPFTTWTIKYYGQETVTVPAGTFVTCKFGDIGDDDSSGRESLNWIARGWGVSVKGSSVNEQGQTMTLELLPGSSLNGRPIQ